ncbi:MAG: D-alanyl-D-alanine carboxypeptidase/D-alanyl-D-alanine-endopeptidase [Ignavibacteriales bacterium]|nr:D-alanyl-D-alanine carboxypeptidase/D-alanyl-D-alanine-endopeptidase [Ignavibacteriales bacterium]
MKKNTEFLFAFLFFSTSIFAQNFNKQIEDEINEIYKDVFLKSSMLAVSIYDLTDNKILFQKNEKLLLTPASNMKILTTTTALEFLGTDYSFQTSVFHNGIVMDSICYGDIYVKGGFDPDFTTDDLDSLVSKIVNYGIKEIRGNIYGDVSNMDSLFWGSGWMWDDDPSSDFPYLTPLIINDACVQIEYEPGEINKEVNYKIIPETNYFDVLNNSITKENATEDFEITRDWQSRGNEILIKGSLSSNSKKDTVKINIVNPELYFLYLLKEKLEKQNVEFLGKLDTATAPQFAKLIYTRERKFKDVIVNLNKESDNLSAEMTLRAIALKNLGNPASAQNGIKIIDSLINKTGLNSNDYVLADGSGISRYNLITTELLVDLLKYMFQNSTDNYEVLKNSFPLSGVDGTLSSRMKDTKAYKNVNAKTGTLSGVSSLSGYLKSANSHDITFSIMIQNFIGSSKKARNIQDRICTFLSELSL